MSKEKRNTTKPYKKKLIRRRKPNRSIAGDLFLYLFLLLVAVAMVFPLVFAVESALKPLDELYKFPPKVFAQNPTLDNFADLFVTMGKSWVTFPRYVFNTVFITTVGTAGHLIIASMAAFVLAKYEFPGGNTFFKLVTVAMMFSGYVTAIPNYVIINNLNLIDTYWAVIIPAFAAPMGLFLILIITVITKKVIRMVLMRIMLNLLRKMRALGQPKEWDGMHHLFMGIAN